MFVVYRVRDGKTVGVYDTECAAKSRTSKNNRKLTMSILSGKDESDRPAWDRLEGWDYCAFVDYAPHMRRFFKDKNYYFV
jgi:hypothetical protein